MCFSLFQVSKTGSCSIRFRLRQNLDRRYRIILNGSVKNPEKNITKDGVDEDSDFFSLSPVFLSVMIELDASPLTTKEHKLIN